MNAQRDNERFRESRIVDPILDRYVQRPIVTILAAHIEQPRSFDRIVSLRRPRASRCITVCYILARQLYLYFRFHRHRHSVCQSLIPPTGGKVSGGTGGLEVSRQCSASFRQFVSGGLTGGKSAKKIVWRLKFC